MICLDNAVLAAVDAKTTDLSYSVGDIVFERGGPAQFVYVVKRGALCRFRASPEGRRSILQFLFAGDGFGFETGRYHRDTVQALTGTEVLAAGRNALLAASTSPSSNVLFDAAARAYVMSEEQAILLRGTTATERMALFLLEMNTRLSVRGQFDLPMRRTDISDHLGLTPETVSRAMNEFRRSKIIEFGDQAPRRIVIRDKTRLEQLASAPSEFEWWKRYR